MTVWTRVRDAVTGHHYDVTVERMEQLVERGAAEEIPGRRHRGRPKPPKYLRPAPPAPLPEPTAPPSKTRSAGTTTATSKDKESESS